MAIEEKKVRFKKVGGGSFRLSNPNRIIKPGETFVAYPSDIPKAFKDVVIPLEPIEVISGKPVNVVKTKYKLVASQRKDRFDIIGPDDKKINDKPLTEEKANKLISDMEG